MASSAPLIAMELKPDKQREVAGVHSHRTSQRTRFQHVLQAPQANRSRTSQIVY